MRQSGNACKAGAAASTFDVAKHVLRTHRPYAIGSKVVPLGGLKLKFRMP